MQDTELDIERGAVRWHNMKALKVLPKRYVANEKVISRIKEAKMGLENDTITCSEEAFFCLTCFILTAQILSI